jgi:ribose/xylose/arabinose/galactoside ABC-type transport system permease subunit
VPLDYLLPDLTDPGQVLAIILEAKTARSCSRELNMANPETFTEVDKSQAIKTEAEKVYGDRSSSLARVSHFFQENNQYVVWAMLVLIFVFSTVASPHFLTFRNMMNILRQGSLLGIVAIGQTIVLLSRGADLSESAVMTLSALVALNTLDGHNERIAEILLIAVGIGILVGFVNGLIVSKAKVPPFLLTLGTREVIYGVALVYTNGIPSGNLTPLFREIMGQFMILGIPGQVIFWGSLSIIFWFVLKKTAYGRKLYATGANRRAARQSGIKTDRTIITAYIISGILAAIGGMILSARAGYADNFIGKGYELNAVAASVIGGTAFSGGKGGLFGTIGGVLLMVVLQNILNLLGVNPSFYLVINGLVIVVAVISFIVPD